MTETLAPAKGRSGRTARDMALSMIVLLLPLALVVAIFRARGGEDVVVIDPGPAIAEAQRSGTLPVTVPTGLEEGWRPVSAGFTIAAKAGTLRLGYLTPSGAGVQLIQSSEAVESLLIRELGDDVRPTGVREVVGTSWDTYLARGEENAMVREQPGKVTIVIGHAPLTELDALAAGLS